VLTDSRGQGSLQRKWRVFISCLLKRWQKNCCQKTNVWLKTVLSAKADAIWSAHGGLMRKQQGFYPGKKFNSFAHPKPSQGLGCVWCSRKVSLECGESYCLILNEICLIIEADGWNRGSP
jgi:hypothetical protein